jgi:hypothetical protein
VVEHLGLGTRVDPGGVPRCAAVLRLAGRVPPGGSLAAVPRRQVEAFALGSLPHPAGWTPPGSRPTLIPDGAGTIRARVRIARAGIYGLWLEGGVRPQVDLLIDGREVNSVRGELENLGQYVELGATPLRPGVHRVEIRFHGSDLVPGSGGSAGPVGPLVVSPQDTGDTKIVRLPPSRARRLCGHRLDWVEAVAAHRAVNSSATAQAPTTWGNRVTAERPRT